MQHAVLVGVVDGAGSGDVPGGQALRQRAFRHALRQRHPLDVGHAEVRPALAGADLVDRDDARMIEPPGSLRLSLKPGQVRAGRQVAAQDHLHRDDAIQALLLRLEDNAHAPRPSSSSNS